MIDFVKMHGTGNDFPIIPDLDDRLEISAESVRALADRNFGIGGDGVIRIAPGKNAPYFMDYRNPDGSIAEICGNGVRVVGKWLGDRGYADDSIDLETRAGVKRLDLYRANGDVVTEVTADMGPPVGEIKEDKIVAYGTAWSMTLVSMWNPHAVIFVDDVDESPVDTVGPFLETHERFPEGTNVEFVDLKNGRLRQRTWERGAGETLSCGSAACAVAVAAQLSGRVGKQVPIDLRGGQLMLEWSPGESVKLTGPAAEVFSGQIDEERFGIVVRK